MYKKEFDNLLKQNKTFSAYMFYGQSTYMVEHYASLIAKSFSCDEDIEKVYFDEYNFRDIKNKLLQNSLFASNHSPSIPHAPTICFLYLCVYYRQKYIKYNNIPSAANVGCSDLNRV